MGTMRQVVVNSTEDIRVEEVPRPGPPGPGEVRVASALVGICGSDTHAAAGLHPFIDRPYRPGHEVVGAVEEVGPGVSDLAPGDRVVLEPSLVCGQCRRCREGRYNICENLAVVGCQTAGGMADAFTVPRDRLHRVPAGMSDELAALVEPLATPMHAVRLAGVGPGGRARSRADRDARARRRPSCGSRGRAVPCRPASSSPLHFPWTVLGRRSPQRRIRSR
ncbi:MAG: hypothetical protein JWR58_2603 [Pseudonocardia sp.]|nr:hypothetical protein [Pseudonocardia sp.]